jgi:hypothetical protein
MFYIFKLFSLFSLTIFIKTLGSGSVGTINAYQHINISQAENNKSLVLFKYLSQNIAYFWKLCQNFRCKLILIGLMAVGTVRIVVRRALGLLSVSLSFCYLGIT